MKGKEHYSYFLIKPDGIRYFNEIKQDIKVLYGNKAIVILVSSDKEYAELVNEVYDLKIEIRKKLAYKVGLVTIADEKEQEDDDIER